MFVDRVDVELQAGKGGDGKLSFRHEKYRAKGGPDGGDGGHGGGIVFEVNHNLNTLSHFRAHRVIKAEPGQDGKKDRAHGKSGRDTIIKVPPGTVVYYATPGVAPRTTPGVDLTAEGQQAVIAKGGRGGFGNAHFTSATRQTPRLAELGEPGESKKATVELKLLADVGLVGLPNAGKSTLLSVISNARPEIADYPFTTLAPQLGIAEIDNASLVVADVPGLIEGASKGKGLGDEFLRHIERTAVILHLVDASSIDPAGDWRQVNGELAAYSTDLSTKPQLIVLTKTDLVDKLELKLKIQLMRDLVSSQDRRPGLAPGVYAISAPAHQGLRELLRAAAKLVGAARQASASQAPSLQDEIPVIDVASRSELWQVERQGSGFVITGGKIEGFARRTDFKNPAALERLRDIMGKLGVVRELERLGVRTGDKVKISDKVFEW